MALYLGSRELDAIGTVADALAAPLAFDSARSWALDAGERFRYLLGGEAAILFGSGFDAPAAWSPQLDSPITHRVAGHIGRAEPMLRTGSVARGARPARRRTARMDVYTMADVLAAPRRGRLGDLPIYDEVAQPSRMPHAYGLASVGDMHESHLVVMSSRDDRWRFRDDTRELARLLLPAFRAGSRILSRAGMPPDDPRRPVGSLPDAVAIFDRQGKQLLDSSPELTRVVETTGSGELLSEAIRGVARSVAASVRARSSGDVARSLTVSRRLRLPAADVEIVATWLGATLAPATDAVRVAVHSTATRLPSRGELMRSRGLTPREADVAVLLARGVPRGQIAQTLELSADTVRRHTEAVYRKLKVHTRSGVAAGVLRGV